MFGFKLQKTRCLLFRINLPGSGSDFTPFIEKVGVTVADFQYRFSPHLDLNDYPLYHTAYESFYYVDHILDPGFKVCITWHTSHSTTWIT